MAAIAPLDPRTPLGVAPAPANATATTGDTIAMEPGKTYLVIVNNGAVGAITVDIDDPASGSGGTPEYNDVPVAATNAKVFTFKRPHFGKTPTENITIICSAVTTVTIEAYGPLD